jgi:hypothetical protein
LEVVREAQVLDGLEVVQLEQVMVPEDPGVAQEDPVVAQEDPVVARVVALMAQVVALLVVSLMWVEAFYWLRQPLFW